MPLFLTERDTEAMELMDDPTCDLEELNNTYRQFGVINSLVSQWHKIYRNRIAAVCTDPDRTYTLLDIGFGGGDIPSAIDRWARDDGIDLEITAIETDKRAYDFVQRNRTDNNVSFELASSTDLVEDNSKFDFVISNHLLHHLDRNELLELLDEAEKLSGLKVLFNDLERSDISYILFNLLSRPVFRSSFITKDGSTSIRRSYTKKELRRTVPERWMVESIFPYRLLLSYHHE